MEKISKNEYRKKWRLANLEKMREYNRVYNKKWRQINGYHNEKKSITKYPEKIKARRKLQKYVFLGKIHRCPCSICGKPNAQAHHDDYSRPLDVKWFCALHHREYEENRCG
jgi:hypothetical protein